MPVVEGERARSAPPAASGPRRCRGRGPATDLEPAVGAEAVRVEELLAAHEMGPPRPAPGTASPELAAVRNTRSPTTIGDECPRPSIRRFQRMFSPAPQRSGAADPALAPAPGPRHPGQSGSAPVWIGPVDVGPPASAGNRNERREQRPSGGTREETHRGAAVASAPGERKAWRWSTPRRNTAPPATAGDARPLRPASFRRRSRTRAPPEDGQVPLDAADQDVFLRSRPERRGSGRVVTDGPGKGRRRSRGRARVTTPPSDRKKRTPR